MVQIPQNHLLKANLFITNWVSRAESLFGLEMAMGDNWNEESGEKNVRRELQIKKREERGGQLKWKKEKCNKNIIRKIKEKENVVKFNSKENIW